MLTHKRVDAHMQGVANEDVRQVIEVLAKEADKMPWLTANLQAFVDNGMCVGRGGVGGAAVPAWRLAQHLGRTW